MIDFITKTFTSLFIAIGIFSPVAPLEIDNMDSPSEIVQDENVPEIIFISGNTVELESRATEAELRVQREKEEQLQREHDLEASRQFRLKREAEMRSTEETAILQEKLQYEQRNFGTRNTSQTFIASDYTRLVDKYHPLLKAWIAINESNDLEYVAGIVNDRIILVRTIDAFGNAVSYSFPSTFPTISTFYNEMYDATEQLASDVSYAKKEITALSRYVESLGGFDASVVGNNENVIQRLRAFVNDGRLTNPSKITDGLREQKTKLSQYDSSYNSSLEVMHVEIIKKAELTGNVGSTTSLPCWQIQINFRDEWEAINERYAAQGAFYSPNRGLEVDSLTSAYKNNNPNCF